MVVRLLSKAVSRILEELHVLSKGIILGLISSFKTIHFINFHGYIDQRKLLTNENSQTTVGTFTLLSTHSSAITPINTGAKKPALMAME